VLVIQANTNANPTTEPIIPPRHPPPIKDRSGGGWLSLDICDFLFRGQSSQKYAIVASTAGRGHDQTRKNSACLAQRWAGWPRRNPAPLLAVNAAWVALSTSVFARPRRVAAESELQPCRTARWSSSRIRLHACSNRSAVGFRSGRAAASSRRYCTAAVDNPS